MKALRAVLIACAVTAVLVAVLFERPHPTAGPPMRDFEAYYSAGVLWQHGQWPYGTAIWNVEKTLEGVSAQRYEALPFVGPPALLPPLSLVARLPFAAANGVWRALLVVALAGIALMTLRLCEPRITPATTLAIAAVAVGFGPLTSALALGQIALPAFFFAVLALRRRLAAIFAFAQPNVALTTIADWRVFATGAGIFALACLAVAGLHGSLDYIAVLREHSAAERFSAIQITPAAIAYGLGATEQLALEIGTAIAIAAVVAWFVLIRRLPDNVSRFCATCALAPLVMPFFHEHDLLILFVPAVVYAVRADARTWPLAAAGALLCATDWLGLAQRPDGTIQTLLLAGAFGAALVSLRDDARVQMLLVPVVLLALIGVAGIAAQSHPAPVWPDAMSASPAISGTKSIAAAWHAEQSATGLFQRNAFWALLRCLPLLGCAALAYAVALSSKSIAGSKNPLPGLA